MTHQWAALVVQLEVEALLDMAAVAVYLQRELLTILTGRTRPTGS